MPMSSTETVSELLRTTEVRAAGPPSSVADAEPAILRLDASGVADAMERFGAPSALAAGQVDVIDLDGVREHMGERWGDQQAVIHRQVGQMLARRLGPDAVFERLDETHYIVAQAGQTRAWAQGHCFGCLREILHHFVGEALPSDLRLQEVTLVTSTEIHGRRVELDEALASEIVVGDPEADSELSPAHSTRFVAANGRSVRVSCALEPVVNLASSSRIGFRLARRVLDAHTDRPLNAQELQNLSRADIARVDYATIARGLDRLHAEAGEDKLPTLIVPVSCATLANERTRQGLVGLLEQARTEVRLGLVCEICDIDGLGHEALAQDIALIRPFCMRLLAYVAEPRPAVFHPLRGLDLDGVSMDCPPNLGDAEFVGWTREAAKAAHAVAGALFLYRVQSIQRGALASLAGASHVTIATASKG